MGLPEFSFLERTLHAYLSGLGSAVDEQKVVLNTRASEAIAALQPTQADYANQIRAILDGVEPETRALRDSTNKITEISTGFFQQLQALSEAIEPVGSSPLSHERAGLHARLLEEVAADIRATRGDREADEWLLNIRDTANGLLNPEITKPISRIQPDYDELSPQLPKPTTHQTIESRFQLPNNIPPVEHWDEVISPSDNTPNRRQTLSNALNKFIDSTRDNTPGRLLTQLPEQARNITAQGLVEKYPNKKGWDQATLLMAVLANTTNRGLPPREQLPVLGLNDHRLKAFLETDVVPAVKDGRDTGVEPATPIGIQALEHIRQLNQEFDFLLVKPPREVKSYPTLNLTLSIPTLNTDFLKEGLQDLE